MFGQVRLNKIICVVTVTCKNKIESGVDIIFFPYILLLCRYCSMDLEAYIGSYMVAVSEICLLTETILNFFDFY